MTDNTIVPITRQEFADIVTDNLAERSEEIRYAWLRLTYAREYLCCRERGDITSAPTNAWGYWVAYGFRAAIKGQSRESHKAANELLELCKDANNRR